MNITPLSGNVFPYAPIRQVARLRECQNARRHARRRPSGGTDLADLSTEEAQATPCRLLVRRQSSRGRHPRIKLRRDEKNGAEHARQSVGATRVGGREGRSGGVGGARNGAIVSEAEKGKKDALEAKAEMLQRALESMRGKV